MAQNIIFMGTPEFSVPILKSLNESKHNILEVYTQPPKKKNRGQVINLTPVHEFSNENSINVTSPDFEEEHFDFEKCYFKNNNDFNDNLEIEDVEYNNCYSDNEY